MSGNPLVDAALRYAARGWRVLPIHTIRSSGSCSCNQEDCTSPGKHPRTWHGVLDTTTDSEQIRTWWHRWPRANVGIATGEASGLFIVDIDPRHGGEETWRDWQAQFGKLPDLPVNLTGGGGQQYLFEHPRDGRIRNAVALGPGVDVRGDGGFVVAPPSLHKSGRTYQWEISSHPDDLDPAPAPKWLLHRVLEQPSPNGVISRLDASAILAGVPKGERDVTLFRLACKLRNADIPHDWAERLVLEAAGQCYDPATGLLDPFPADVAAEKVKRAYEKYVPEPKVEVRRNGHTPSTDGDDETFTAAALLSMELAPPRWAVPDLIPEGLSILAGKPKLGKSWLILHVAVAIAFGVKALGHYQTVPGDVLYLALEDNKRRLKERLEILLAAVDTETERAQEALHRLTFATAAQWARSDEGGLTRIEEWIQSHPDAKLVVVDTLAKFRPKKTKSSSQYDEDYAVCSAIQEIALKHNVCILIIHHHRKLTADDWVDSASGTLGIAGSADGLYGLFRERGQADATLKMTGRDVADAELALQWDKDAFTWKHLGNADDYRISREQAEIIDVLKKIGGWTKPKDVSELCGKAHQATKMALWRMAQAGLIEGAGGQYRAKP